MNFWWNRYDPLKFLWDPRLVFTGLTVLGYNRESGAPNPDRSPILRLNHGPDAIKPCSATTAKRVSAILPMRWTTLHCGPTSGRTSRSWFSSHE